ncbi:MAG: type II toxin-antitoxin system VapC family toxin [Micrococcus sp.]|nr:type II toxin-antitoxin system VapC family toxin [Micrococcus sp.]
MNYLLDTNVLSELRKSPRRANPAVRSWASSRPAHELYISVVTLLEIELGIERLSRRDSGQASRLRRWVDEEVMQLFRGRIMSLGVDEMRVAARFHVPDPRPERDALIAATALVHDLVVVTRNVDDFAPTGVTVLDPWQMR